MSLLLLSILIWLGTITTEQTYTLSQMQGYVQQNAVPIQTVYADSALASTIYSGYGSRAAEVVIVDLTEQ